MRTNIRVVMQCLGVPIDEEVTEQFDEAVLRARLEAERYDSLRPISSAIGRGARFRLRIRRLIRRYKRWIQETEPKPLPRGPYR